MHKKRYLLDVARYISSLIRSPKKGQVTVFIILGLLLILAVILIVALQSEIISLKPGELIPTEKGKIESFISTCIKEIGEEAVFLIGIQGGYIGVPEDLARDGSSHLRLSPDHVVPFWAQGPLTFIPSLNELKIRIDNYLNENVRECLFDSQAFQETYNLIEREDISADTKLTDNGIIFDINWNLEVRNKDGEVVAELIDHVAESPVKLKSVHNLAREIVEQEMTSLKLEDITQDLIALEHPDVPVAGFEMTCSSKKWKVSEAKNTLKDMLRINLRELKVKGTEFVEFPEEFPYYQNHYIWDIREDVSSDVSAAFKFDNNYPFIFQVTPSDGNTMKSGGFKGNDLISNLCLQFWKFTYDVTYPVLVQVRDETTGYNFNSAMTVHLVRNQPNRNVPIQARQSSSLSFADDDAFCDNRRIPMTIMTSELVDNKKGVFFTEPLEGVDVSFTCLKYRCDIGQTNLNFAQRGAQAGFTANLPYCVGGIMRGEKDGYKEGWERVVTTDDGEVELNLVPLYEIPTSRLKILKHEINNEKVSPGKELDQDEIASVRLVFEKDKARTLFQQPFHESRVGIFGQLDSEVMREAKLEFLGKADFIYQLEINLLDETQLLGGYKANWTVPWSKLEGAEEIIFHVVGMDRPSDEESFELLLGMEKLSKNLPVPEIK